jgi:hypothetical protein
MPEIRLPFARSTRRVTPVPATRGALRVPFDGETPWRG